MQFRRFLLEPTVEQPDRLDVVFDRNVAVIEAGPDDLARIRLAIEQLLTGNVDFGTVTLQVGEVEIDVNAELARELGLRLGSDYRIIDAGSYTTGAPGREDVAGTIALRAALELEGAVAPELGPRDVEMALQAIQAEKALAASTIEVEIAEARRRNDDAVENLKKIAHWKGNILRAAEEARAARSGRLGSRWSPRAARAEEELDELLRAGNFSDFDDFELYTRATESDYQRQLNQATTDLDIHERRLAELRRNASLEPRLKQLAAQEYAVRVRKAKSRLGHDESMENALRVMVGLGLGGEISHQPIVDATAWLHQLEGSSPVETLATQVQRHTVDVPVIGPVPLVIDGAFTKLDATPRQQTLAALDAALGRTQIVLLGPDSDTKRWALGRDDH